jgi:hypothetical protein
MSHAEGSPGWPRRILTGVAQSLIGGYFLGPSASGQAVFYFSNRGEQADAAKYLNALWKQCRLPTVSRHHHVRLTRYLPAFRT